MITIDQILAEKIGEIMVGEWPIGNFILCFIALVLSIALCGVIGIERERRGRSAGLRTHLLVGVGSCLIMIISIYGFPAAFGSRDVARLAAQVIAGVGFLGAGAIIHRNSGTKGLTTAATIWIVMAIGLACGSMNFILAIVGTALILVVLTLFRKIENKINRSAPLVKLKAKENTPVATKLLQIAQKYDCVIHDLQIDLLDSQEIEATFLVVSNTNEFRTNEFLAELEAVEGVEQAGVLNGHKM
ncbi:MAG: MgtC/SapB family protein [Bacilli bacterium]|nr:MgtC/SapB family protein [Bacilli bacterium]